MSAIVSMLLLLFPFSAAQSQTEEEMAILSLYYRPEELQVISATRSLKPISQVAENITVINAAEIRAMNAHTLGEVLRQVPGIFISSNQDFGAISLPYIQGSELRHIQVYVDNIPWNSVYSGEPAIQSIPVGAVERIEIVKGPASSSWGSSLGGVINVITKSAGHTQKPIGMLQASYGEAASQNYQGEISGKAGNTGYYLFADHQESDGLEPTREYENSSLFSKLRIPLWERTAMGITFGYSEPWNDLGEYTEGDMVSDIQDRTVWGAIDFNTSLSERMAFFLSLYGFRQKYNTNTSTLGAGIYSDRPELLLNTGGDQRIFGFAGNLTWENEIHRLVLGADGNRADMERVNAYGPLYQGYGAPPKMESDSKRNLWALYLNDTVTLGNFAITPGIRYDHHEFIGGFISPSLDLTCHWKEILFRAAASRGFSAPGIGLVKMGGFLLAPNPDLDYEKIWSYQLGAETSAIPYLWARINLFQHEIEDILSRELYAEGPPGNTIMLNKNEDRRRGFEIEMETLPIHDFSFFGGFSYVITDNQAQEENDEKKYKWVAGLRYNNPKIISLRLAGIYTWWDEPSSSNASYDDPIWDLNLRRNVSIGEINADLFATIHNMFDGSSYDFDYYDNPKRWMEAGIRFHF